MFADSVVPIFDNRRVKWQEHSYDVMTNFSEIQDFREISGLKAI